MFDTKTPPSGAAFLCLDHFRANNGLTIVDPAAIVQSCSMEVQPAAALSLLLPSIFGGQSQSSPLAFGCGFVFRSNAATMTVDAPAVTETYGSRSNAVS